MSRLQSLMLLHESIERRKSAKLKDNAHNIPRRHTSHDVIKVPYALIDTYKEQKITSVTL